MIFVGHGLAFGVWAGSVPRIRDLWTLRDGLLGLVLLGLSLGALAAMPIGGWLARNYGPARVALVAGLVSAPLLLGPALVHGLPVSQAVGRVALIASTVAFGLAAGTMNIAMNAEASAVERRAGRAIMSSVHGGWSLGGLLGSGVAATCTAIGFSTLATLATGSLLVASLVAGAGALLTAKTSVRAKVRAAEREPTAPVRSLLALGAMAAICFTLEGALADWSGVFMLDVHAVPVAAAAATYSGIALAMLLARLGGDATRRKLGAVAVTRLGGGVTAMAMSAVLLVGPAPLAFLGFALVGLGVANIVPVVFSAAGARAGAGGITVVASIGYAGLLGGPPVIGFAAQALTLRVALWLLVAGAVTLTLLAGSVSPSKS